MFMGKAIKTIAGLQRTWNAKNKRDERRYRRNYVLQPAVARYLWRFEQVLKVVDPITQAQAFRNLPALEGDLAAVDAEFTAKLPIQQRRSMAQQEIAKRPRIRLTEDGKTLEGIIADLILQTKNAREKKAKEYWRPLVARLHQLGLNPTPLDDPDDASKERLQYGEACKRRVVTLGQFENIVSKVRQRLSSQ